ncbi:uncharacterized protein LOC132190624 [Corylus avellana]|uniref:uncharacterized protein LOC132190624 n=1 Tax=Corylus avellana TaxID=13451 RepID=UPI00286C152A|nr:uncharacterized protein LOC132190624 [Corylus avellana]XP_059461647.1 uncharacterized protein LOC132190624 [Corylus avellana]
MRIVQICKTLISLSHKNPPHLHKPPIPHYSISLFFLSSSSSSSVPSSEQSNSTIAVVDYLINQQQFSPEAALKASSAITYLKKPEAADSILLFLKESGFSKTHIEQVVKSRPEVLSSKLTSTIKPKIKVFQDLGFAPDDIADIISTDPWILTRSAHKLGPSILVLKSILGSNAGVVRVLKISAWFLKHDLQKTMLPNIEFMKHCGISSSQIVKYLFNFPRFFLLKPASIRDFVQTVDEMGCNRKSKMFLSAIRTVSSMTEENWELKLKLFRSLGFSESDILDVFRRVPQVFAVSERKIKGVTEVLLLSAWNIDISYIVSHPELLICSIENRLKPRLRVLEILEKKNMLKKKPCLTTVCKMTEKRFSDKYLLPYSKELTEPK